MRRRIYHTLLTLPVLLVLLHSVTPHQHVSSREGTVLVAYHQCFDNLLSQIFQVDLGENHLEEFQTSRCNADVSLDLVLFIAQNFDLICSAEEGDQACFIPEAVAFQSSFLSGSRSLRAPPVV